MWRHLLLGVVLLNSMKGSDSIAYGSKLLRLACEVKDMNGDVQKRTCGCEKEKTVPCDVGPLAIQSKNGALSLTFCNVTANWTNPEPYGGIFHRACIIKEDKPTSPKVFQTYACSKAAGQSVPCTLGPIKTYVNGTKALAYLCNRLGSHKVDEKDIFKDSTCVSLAATHKMSVKKTGKSRVGSHSRRPPLRPPHPRPPSSKGRVGAPQPKPGHPNPIPFLGGPTSNIRLPNSGTSAKSSNIPQGTNRNGKQGFVSSSQSTNIGQGSPLESSLQKSKDTSSKHSKEGHSIPLSHLQSLSGSRRPTSGTSSSGRKISHSSSATGSKSTSKAAPAKKSSRGRRSARG